jgi:2-dehydro-3-deoxy-L-rhamnonate dehydrogenase (NAD+)
VPARSRSHARVAIVTGGRGSLGRAIADRLQRNGFGVVAADLAPIAPRQPYRHVRVDLTDERQVAELFADVRRREGRLDAVVLAAGEFVFAPLLRLRAADWQRAFAANAQTAFLCVQHAVRAMRGRGGRIVHLGSFADQRALPGNAAYGAAKAAVRMLLQVANAELTRTRVRLTNLSLGTAATPSTRMLRGRGAPAVPVAEVAETIAWLLDRPLTLRYDELSLLPPHGASRQAP